MNGVTNKFRKIFYLVVLALLSFSCNDHQLFRSLSVSSTGVDFINKIEKTKNVNIGQSLFMYHGGGVAVGDVNNDGLPDIYFTANQNTNKLYINKGGLKFDDKTEMAGVGGCVGLSSWTTGVTMVDINSDGWLDIYVCQLHGLNGLKGGNNLFVNNGDGTYVERAREYGLDAYSYAQQTVFFDFDLDGDLDMYLLNQGTHTPNSFKKGELRVLRDSLAGDRLYENQDNFYVDISKEAGIYGGSMGYGLSIGIGDINNDNYPDIYVSNDFHENDYLYYNKGDGTFDEKIRKSMGHLSFSSKGNDIADINNDGWLDLITLDMNPDNEKVFKMSLSSDEYNIYQSRLNHGYYHQYQRNMLQINRGVLFGCESKFSEVGEIAGISATDWSWTSLFADFDLDGNKDLFISNGIPYRPTDLDYLNQLDSATLDLESMISEMPAGEISNVVYKNTGKKFVDVSKDWGLELKGCSNGAAYADLDNDGDLDLVLNNLNAPASIYENRASKQLHRNFIKVRFEGKQGNTFGIGTRVSIYTSGVTQMQELFNVRGWLSSMDNCLVFGLGSVDMIERLEINWKDGKGQVLKNVKVNQTISVRYANAVKIDSEVPKSKSEKIFEVVDETSGIDFRHQENDFIDFDYEKIIPRMLSREGPKMEVGDVNNDGLDDFYIGGAKNQSGKLYVQKEEEGENIFTEVENNAFYKDRVYEDIQSVFLDVDQDDDLDLYVVSGGNEPFKDYTLTDRLYINDGCGKFTKSVQHPQFAINGSCAVVGDINQDGFDDIFIGGRSIPGSYGKYPRSRILLGDGDGRLFDATARAFANDINLGMVTDAVWLEESKELIVVGEWLPITILSFREGKIEEKKLKNTSGWWNTIHAADMDGDGDKDLLVGNMGLNSNLQASVEYPVNLYIKDFDKNGSIDPILSYYRNGTEYPYYGRDELARQLVAIKKEYPTYKSYAKSTFSDVFPIEELSGAGRWQVRMFESIYLENRGEGNFQITVLGDELQIAPIYGFTTGDFDGNGTQDILAVGNFFSNQISMGRYDASYGHFLVKSESGDWEYIEPGDSGFAIDGEARDIKVLNYGDGEKLILVSRNNTDRLSHHY